MFEKALEIDPTHRETLDAVIELQAQQGDWEAVVHAKRGLMADRERRRRRSRCSTRSAASTTSSCRTRRRRSAAYLEALEVAPEDHQLLQKLLDLYTETKQWKKAVETIERFVALESDAVRKGAYYHAAGDHLPRRAEVARRGGRLLQPGAR